jgi:hypothetical protein
MGAFVTTNGTKVSIMQVEQTKVVFEIRRRHHSGSQRMITISSINLQIDYEGLRKQFRHLGSTETNLGFNLRYENQLLHTVINISEHPVFPTPAFILRLQEALAQTNDLVRFTLTFNIDGFYAATPSHMELSSESFVECPIYLVKCSSEKSTKCSYTVSIRAGISHRLTFPFFVCSDMLSFSEFSGVAFLMDETYSEPLQPIKTRIGVQHPLSNGILPLHRLYTPVFLTHNSRLDNETASIIRALPIKHVVHLSGCANAVEYFEHDIPVFYDATKAVSDTEKLQSFVDRVLFGEQIVRRWEQFIIMPEDQEACTMMSYYCSLFPARYYTFPSNHGTILNQVKAIGASEVIVVQSPNLACKIRASDSNLQVTEIEDLHQLKKFYPGYFAMNYSVHMQGILALTGCREALGLPPNVTGPEICALVHMNGNSYSAIAPTLAFCMARHAIVFPFQDISEDPNAQRITIDLEIVTQRLPAIRQEARYWEIVANLSAENHEIKKRAEAAWQLITAITPPEERTDLKSFIYDKETCLRKRAELEAAYRKEYKRLSPQVRQLRIDSDDLSKLFQVGIINASEFISKHIHRDFLTFISNALSYLLIFRKSTEIPLEFASLSDEITAFSGIGMHIPCGSFMVDDPKNLCMILAKSSHHNYSPLPSSMNAVVVSDPSNTLGGSRLEGDAVKLAIEKQSAYAVKQLSGDEASKQDIKRSVSSAMIFHYTGHMQQHPKFGLVVK